MLGVQLARVDAEHAAVGRREHGEWQRVDAHAESGGRAPALALADENRVVELHAVREADDGIALVDGDADDLHVRVTGLELLEHRDLAEARAAPRGPEIDQQRLAGPALDGLRPAGQAVEREVGKRLGELRLVGRLVGVAADDRGCGDLRRLRLGGARDQRAVAQIAQHSRRAERDRHQGGTGLSHGRPPRGRRRDGGVQSAASFETWALNSSGGTKPTSLKFGRSLPARSKNAIVGGPKLLKRLSNAWSSSSFSVTSARSSMNGFSAAITPASGNVSASISLQEVHQSALKSSITGWLAPRASASAASSAATVAICRNARPGFAATEPSRLPAVAANRPRGIGCSGFSPPSVAPIRSNAPYRQASTPSPFATRRIGPELAGNGSSAPKNTPAMNTSTDQRTSVSEPGSTRSMSQIAMPSMTNPNAPLTVFIHPPTRGNRKPADAPTTSNGTPMPMLIENSATEPRATSCVWLIMVSAPTSTGATQAVTIKELSAPMTAVPT